MKFRKNQAIFDAWQWVWGTRRGDGNAPEWFKEALAQSPDTETGILAQLGDFYP